MKPKPIKNIHAAIKADLPSWTMGRIKGVDDVIRATWEAGMECAMMHCVDSMNGFTWWQSGKPVLVIDPFENVDDVFLEFQLNDILDGFYNELEVDMPSADVLEDAASMLEEFAAKFRNAAKT
jgi:hypothetical protein